MSSDPNRFSFVAAHYCVLQGWTYAPFGIALLVLTCAAAFADALTAASLVGSRWFMVGAVPAAIALGLPFALQARRHYHRTFGRVESDPDRIESPSEGFITFLLLAGAIILFAGGYVFIHASDLFPDYLAFPWMLSGWLGAALLGQWNVQQSLRTPYPLVALVVMGVTFLPLAGVDMTAHLLLHYGVLGGAIWFFGWHEHRLLTRLMPAPAEVTDE